MERGEKRARGGALFPIQDRSEEEGDLRPLDRQHRFGSRKQKEEGGRYIINYFPVQGSSDSFFCR